MKREFKHRPCTRCHVEPAQRSSVLCATCISGERVEEPWEIELALSVVLIAADNALDFTTRDAARFVREHVLREQSKAKHPSGRGQ